MTDAPIPPAPNDATRRQIAAADPARSTWLTANAGSGKTRVLTDRVARLLMMGARPERILCLTYTKAAATEMQNRLLARLGEWAMLPDADLARHLRELGEGPEADLGRARRLFAQAIETPGGLKIQTIHSFCGAILRRFPLEAGVPHGFRELDDRSARRIRAEIIEDMARSEAPEITDLTGLIAPERLENLLRALPSDFDDHAADRDQIAAALELPPDFDSDALLASVFTPGTSALITALIAPMQSSGTNDQRAAAKLARGQWQTPGLDELTILEDVFLLSKDPFSAKIDKVPTKALQKTGAVPDMGAVNALMARVEAARPHRLALISLERSAALNRFGAAFARLYRARKARAGWLDFDDLISRTRRLLDQSEMAQWVLFRLDGGIDHILVDEAQDTSPEQWQVIASLCAEFTAGISERGRTLFVVGDPKQSIYSFQGADISVFEARRDRFLREFEDAQAAMQLHTLSHSFRSSPAILAAVDASFADEAARGLGGAPHHLAFHEARPGRVDLWPVIPPPEKPEPRDWDDPIDSPAPDSAETRLADTIAARISGWLAAGTRLPGENRLLDPGDILILVQGRTGQLFTEIIRALKQAGLPVAGADRLRLAGEMAVRDIRAVLSFLATPEDDLSLAAALRSPLLGLDEQALFRLAAPRGPQFLWEALRASPDHAEARAILSDLMENANLRPYELISRLLIRHQGRARLLTRLGPEAEDGIDELLSQALAYEGAEVPSLTGFLVWLAEDDIEVKRQPGSGDGLIQVMTVHGAKGLERPVVILPQTAQRRAPQAGTLLRPDDGPTMWAGSQAERPPLLAETEASRIAAQEDERRRLLYVAMTRAESWLVVAAAGKVGEAQDSWYAMARDGIEKAATLPSMRLEQIADEDEGEPITRLSFGDWPDDAPPDQMQAANAASAPAPAALPAWLDQPVPVPTRPSGPVAATALGGAKALASPLAEDPETAMLRGTRMHLLIEHLSDSPRADWPDQARALLAGSEGGLPGSDEMAAMLDDLAALIDAPDLAQIFAPPPDATTLREVALTGTVAGIGPLHGVIDRLIIGPEGVTVIDYKTNAAPPDRSETVPTGILRQMAAYRALLSNAYPDRRIDAAILWTQSRELMPLPPALMDAALLALDPGGAGS